MGNVPSKYVKMREVIILEEAGWHGRNEEDAKK